MLVSWLKSNQISESLKLLAFLSSLPPTSFHYLMNWFWSFFLLLSSCAEDGETYYHISSSIRPPIQSGETRETKILHPNLCCCRNKTNSSDSADIEARKSLIKFRFRDGDSSFSSAWLSSVIREDLSAKKKKRKTNRKRDLKLITISCCHEDGPRAEKRIKVCR